MPEPAQKAQNNSVILKLFIAFKMVSTSFIS